MKVRIATDPQEPVTRPVRIDLTAAEVELLLADAFFNYAGTSFSRLLAETIMVKLGIDSKHQTRLANGWLENETMAGSSGAGRRSCRVFRWRGRPE
jgi:hypothetical protein